MIRFSNAVVATVNAAAAVLCLAVAVAGVWVAVVGRSPCTDILRWILVVVGSVFFVVALLGFVGALLRRNKLLGVYLVSMALICGTLFSLTIVAMIKTHDYYRESIPDADADAVDLNTFPLALNKLVKNRRSWSKLRNCIMESQLCNPYSGGRAFYHSKVPIIQRGCCRPPEDCGYTYVNATYWNQNVKPNSDGVKRNDPDCSRWRNGEANLCYQCDTCRASVVAAFILNLKGLATALLILFLIVLALSVLAYLAWINNRNCFKRKQELAQALAQQKRRETIQFKP